MAILLTASFPLVLSSLGTMCDVYEHRGTVSWFDLSLVDALL